ncbi:MAG: hypothetical protein IPN33_15525 [Saprospiraceae bacterium]|nr:hypothetical protein [Saprospiraceae bacterium]
MDRGVYLGIGNNTRVKDEFYISLHNQSTQGIHKLYITLLQAYALLQGVCPHAAQAYAIKKKKAMV